MDKVDSNMLDILVFAENEWFQDSWGAHCKNGKNIEHWTEISMDPLLEICCVLVKNTRFYRRILENSYLARI